jgi:methylenetetrahydrofolate dehydrogenase (NADP+)/methenyltetrahydrofolate cyclohydrolase
MQLLDGKQTSQQVLARLAEEVKAFPPGARLPKLTVMLVGEDPASQIYVKKKAQTAQKLGLLSEVLTYGAEVSEARLCDDLDRLNADETVDGILIQLPLPRHLDSLGILSRVSPEKDVDGFHPVNLGKLLMGQLPTALPCTPAGIMKLLEAYQIPLAGRRAVVVGRSNIVGKPVGLLLLQQNATVTYCHSKTQDLAAVTREADILVAATGVPEMITGEMVSPGVVVVDVGINRVEKGLVGDVHFESVAPKASFITPVPGGVGPMTIATLMSNTVALYKQHQGCQEKEKSACP